MGEVVVADTLHVYQTGFNVIGRRNLRVIGTLGVLAEAAAEGLIDLPVVIARLIKEESR